MLLLHTLKFNALLISPVSAANEQDWICKSSTNAPYELEILYGQGK